jgi:hypothetical protein
MGNPVIDARALEVDEMPRALIATLMLALSLVACGTAAPPASPAAEVQMAADLRGIEQIEVMFHKAGSQKDIELMMSLWADNATFTTAGETFTGKDAIRTFFTTKAGPFQPQNTWISETPAYKIRATADGNKGTIYFECHYVDVKTKSVVSVVGADGRVEKIDGKWLLTTLTASSLPELTP